MGCSIKLDRNRVHVFYFLNVTYKADSETDGLLLTKLEKQAARYLPRFFFFRRIKHDSLKTNREALEILISLYNMAMHDSCNNIQDVVALFRKS